MARKPHAKTNAVAIGKINVEHRYVNVGIGENRACLCRGRRRRNNFEAINCIKRRRNEVEKERIVFDDGKTNGSRRSGSHGVKTHGDTRRAQSGIGENP